MWYNLALKTKIKIMDLNDQNVPQEPDRKPKMWVYVAGALAIGVVVGGFYLMDGGAMFQGRLSRDVVREVQQEKVEEVSDARRSQKEAKEEGSVDDGSKSFNIQTDGGSSVKELEGPKTESLPPIVKEPEEPPAPHFEDDTFVLKAMFAPSKSGSGYNSVEYIPTSIYYSDGSDEVAARLSFDLPKYSDGDNSYSADYQIEVCAYGSCAVAVEGDTNVYKNPSGSLKTMLLEVSEDDLYDAVMDLEVATGTNLKWQAKIVDPAGKVHYAEKTFTLKAEDKASLVKFNTDGFALTDFYYNDGGLQINFSYTQYDEDSVGQIKYFYNGDGEYVTALQLCAAECAILGQFETNASAVQGSVFKFTKAELSDFAESNGFEAGGIVAAQVYVRESGDNEVFYAEGAYTFELPEVSD